MSPRELIFGALVVAVAIAWALSRATPACRAPVSNHALDLQDSVAHDSSAISCARGAIAIPIIEDDNGLPLIDVYLGTPAQRARVVLDSASSDLVLHHERDAAKLRGYDPHASKSARQVRASTVRVTFGTQRDHARVVEDTVELRGVCVRSFDELASSSHTSQLARARARIHSMRVLSTHRREVSPVAGTLPASDYDVCGIGVQAGRVDDTFNARVQRVRTSKADRRAGVFSLVYPLDGTAFIVLGDPPKLAQTSLHELARPASVEHEDYFQVVLRGLRVGNARIDGVPTRALVDTGSNMLFAPPALAKRLIDRIRADAKAPLSIDFEGVSLVVDADRIRDRDARASPLVYASTAMPPNSIVIGAMLFRNMLLRFDSVQCRVAIAQLRHVD